MLQYVKAWLLRLKGFASYFIAIFRSRLKKANTEDGQFRANTSHYQYTPLPEGSSQIRLLTLLPGAPNDPLEGSLATFSIRDLSERKGPDWEALSYCWRSSTRLQPLLISGEVLEVTESLHIALRHLRQTEKPRVIWIDQVCVNQADLKERGEQVQSMSFIYKNAGKVTAWIGEGGSISKLYIDMLSVAKKLVELGSYPPMTKPTAEEEALLFQTLGTEAAFMATGYFSTDKTHDEKRGYLASLCRAFCNNDWFKRLWIVQEAALAKNLVIQYGSVTVDWNIHAKSCLELLWADLVGPDIYGSGMSLTDTIQMLKEENYGSASKKLFFLVNALKYQNTTDAKDRIYGTLGLAETESSVGDDSGSRMPVDYNLSTAQLSKNFALWHIKNEKTLDALSICCSGDSMLTSGQPSWTIDLDRGHSYCDKLFSSELRTLDNYCAGTEQQLQSRYVSSSDALLLGGIEFDTVEQVSVNCHTQELFGVPNTKTWSEWRSLALKEYEVDPYESSDGRLEAFWRTMVTNQMWDDLNSEYVKAPSRFGDEFKNWSTFEDLVSTDDARTVGRSESGPPFYDFINNLMVGNQAHLFRTHRGYLGLACKHVAAGDKVVILWGGHLPFLLRKCDHKEVPTADQEPVFRFIGGQVYVHGIMDGDGIEIAKRAKFHSRDFSII